MARILSIDYGKKRTGLAVTDPLQIIAGGLATVATSGLFEFLQEYIAREEVERMAANAPRMIHERYEQRDVWNALLEFYKELKIDK